MLCGHLYLSQPASGYWNKPWNCLPCVWFSNIRFIEVPRTLQYLYVGIMRSARLHEISNSCTDGNIYGMVMGVVIATRIWWRTSTPSYKETLTQQNQIQHTNFGLSFIKTDRKGEWRKTPFFVITKRGKYFIPTIILSKPDGRFLIINGKNTFCCIKMILPLLQRKEKKLLLSYRVHRFI